MASHQAARRTVPGAGHGHQAHPGHLLALPVHLARYREDGVLCRLRTSAVPRWAVSGSQAIVDAGITAWLLGGVVPLTYVTRALRAPWPGTAPAWHDMAVTCAITLAAAAPARVVQPRR